MEERNAFTICSSANRTINNLFCPEDLQPPNGKFIQKRNDQGHLAQNEEHIRSLITDRKVFEADPEYFVRAIDP